MFDSSEIYIAKVWRVKYIKRPLPSTHPPPPIPSFLVDAAAVRSEVVALVAVAPALR